MLVMVGDASGDWVGGQLSFDPRANPNLNTNTNTHTNTNTRGLGGDQLSFDLKCKSKCEYKSLFFLARVV